MKKFIQIITLIVLVIGFSSCAQFEAEGFEDAENALKAKGDVSVEITEEQKVRPDRDLRSSDDDIIVDGDDTITDDDDDEDDDENASESDR